MLDDATSEATARFVDHDSTEENLGMLGLTRKEVADLRSQRVHEKVTFRALADKFRVSVWTAHRLCAGREN
jgi:hypothetical protein